MCTVEAERERRGIDVSLVAVDADSVQQCDLLIRRIQESNAFYYTSRVESMKLRTTASYVRPLPQWLPAVIHPRKLTS